MTHYFDDLLRDANGHLGSDDLWIPESTQFDLWSFTFKAQPEKHFVSNPPLEFAAKNMYLTRFRTLNMASKRKLIRKKTRKCTLTRLGPR